MHGQIEGTSRQKLERHQVLIYFAAILLGLATGTLARDVAGAFETLLWRVLSLLLFSTFTQVPLVHLPRAARDRRFMGAMLIGNFVLVPLLVRVPIALLPDVAGRAGGWQAPPQRHGRARQRCADSSRCSSPGQSSEPHGLKAGSRQIGRKNLAPIQTGAIVLEDLA